MNDALVCGQKGSGSSSELRLVRNELENSNQFAFS